MASTQRYPHIVSKQIIRDNKKTGAFRWEVNNLFSVNATAQGLVIKLGLMGYSTRST